mmetsp:Transcript_13662/g.32046  ORF Transcript_13662/g.32046 Transcript_13662/m.32046 type:complete len:110 (+) Transcript_13662:216-545(+)
MSSSPPPSSRDRRRYCGTIRSRRRRPASRWDAGGPPSPRTGRELPRRGGGSDAESADAAERSAPHRCRTGTKTAPSAREKPSAAATAMRGEKKGGGVWDRSAAHNRRIC